MAPRKERLRKPTSTELRYLIELARAADLTQMPKLTAITARLRRWTAPRKPKHRPTKLADPTETAIKAWKASRPHRGCYAPKPADLTTTRTPIPITGDPSVTINLPCDYEEDL